MPDPESQTATVNDPFAAEALMATEEDAKYRKKYGTLWRKTQK